MKLRVLTLSTLIVGLLFCPGLAAADPAAAARYYEDGLARFNRGDRVGAVIQLKNALQQERSMLAAQLLLARAYFEEGDVGPAEVAFTEALRLGVDRSEVAVPLARIHLARGKPEELIAKVPAEGLPDAVAYEVHALRGVAYAALGKADASRDSFMRARLLKPDAVLPLIDEVPILLAARQLKDARERASRAVELAPENAAAWNANASVRHAESNLEEALTHYGRAIELEPDYVDARVARAGLLIDLGRDTEAQVDLHYLHEKDMADARATYLRALLASRAGDEAASNAHLAEVAGQIDALPAEWLAWREQLLMLGALAHHAQGQTARARSYLDVLAARYPGNVGARRLLAAVLLDESEFEKARNLLEQILRAHPNDVQARFLLGQVYYAQKRYAQAEAQLTQAVELGSGPEAGIQAALGLTRLASGDSAQALGNLQAAWANAPDNPGIASTLASLYMRRGDPASAVKVAESLVEHTPDSALGQNLLGVTLGAVGDGDGARKAYGEALRIDPAFRPARLNLVRLDVSQGRSDDARAALNAMLAANRQDAVAMFELGVLELNAGRFDEATGWLEKSLLQNPAALRAGLMLVEAHLARGAAPQALDAAKSLAVQHGRDPEVLSALARTQLAVGDRGGAQQTLRGLSLLAEFNPDVQVRLGYVQLSAGIHDDAAYSAHKALTGRPGDAAALTLAAEVALARGQETQAAAFIDELMLRHPAHADSARLAGELAFARQDFDAADRHFRAALSTTPDSALLLRRMQALVQAGRIPGAIRSGRDWLAARPDDSKVRGALAELHMMAGDWDAARSEYARLVEAGGATAATYNNLANVLDRIGDPAAIDNARKAYALEPGNPFVIDTLGWLLVRGGGLEEGLRHLRDARLRAPENAEIRYHLAHALAQAGLSGEARREVEYALGSGTSFDERREAEALLARLDASK